MGNIAARLIRRVDAVVEHPAFVTPTTSVTFGELGQRVARIRGGLLRAGVSPGDRVALLVSGPAFAEAYLAVLGIGAVAVPLNLLAPGLELETGLARTGAEAAIAEGPLSVAATAAGATVLDPGELAEAEPGPETLDVDDDAPAALLMTSGTTGEARAATLTHGSLRANLDQLSAHPGMRAEPGDVGLALLPLFHVFGLNVVLGFSLYSGTTLAFPDEHGPAAWLDAVRQFGVTVVLGTPQLFEGWLKVGPPRDALESVRVAVSGAAPLARETFDAFAEHFGKPLWEGYGLTEASPVVSSTRMDPEPVPGSVGRPLPGVEVELRAADGEIALVGDPGEIWIRGDNVFGGYWNDPEATAEVVVDGWLRAGDIAVADDDGRLYLVDRSRDIVIVSGFNVFPAEVEDALTGHPNVAEAAVVGRPSDRTGERVVAFVVAEGAAPDTEALRDFCADRLSRYKVPTEINVVDALPHTFIGKVRRGALKGQ